MEGRREADQEWRTGGWIGVEGVSMHAEPEIHSSRPGLRASHTYTNALIVIHRPTLSSLETPRALLCFYIKLACQVHKQPP